MSWLSKRIRISKGNLKKLGGKIKKALKKIEKEARKTPRAIKMSRKARKITNEAQNKVYINHKLAQSKATELIQFEKEVFESFIKFQDLVEKIHNRPIIKNNINDIDIPVVDFPKVRRLYTDIIKATTVGIVLIVPEPIKIPLALFAGDYFYRKAQKRLDKAIQIQANSQKIVEQYSKIIDAIGKMYECIFDVKVSYDTFYNKLFRLVVIKKKTDYKQYDDKEKAILNNTAKLVQILVTLFKATIQEKQLDDKNKNNNGNIEVKLELSEEKINKAVEDAKKGLENIDVL